MSYITAAAHCSAKGIRRAVVACLCAIVLAALAGCSGSSAGAASGSAAPAAGSGGAGGSDTAITIKDFIFTTPASVSPGATVTVHNMDGLAHTVTADGGDFDSPAPAGTSSFTAPTKPGSYPFHCSIHPEMHGTLVVK
jgi:plastocyanin